jgi:hypothetical protein
MPQNVYECNKRYCEIRKEQRYGTILLFATTEERMIWVMKKTSVMGYRTIFEASGIHHSNSGLQITHDMYKAGCFMLLFDLTPDRGASGEHTSYPDNGNITQLKFVKALPDAIIYYSWNTIGFA